MSKLGAHVVTGSRNGYGDYCKAKPAVILAMGEGGALVEAKTNSDGHTITIYRHILWPEQPVEGMTPDQARQKARETWPALRAEWQRNPADFYTIENEPAAHNVAQMKACVAFEDEIMNLSEPDGFKLCLANLAWGTPDDGEVTVGIPNGGIQTWINEWVPLIKKGFSKGHIYGRHGYSQLSDPSSLRPFQEADYLLANGIIGMMIITELGVNDGSHFPGIDTFMQLATQFDAKMQGNPIIGGGCLWTLGKFQSGASNWQNAIPAMTQYLKDHPSPPWTPPTTPPPTGNTWQEIMWQDSVNKQAISLNPDAAFQRAIYQDGFVPVQSEQRIVIDGTQYGYQAGEHLAGKMRRVYYTIVPHWNDIEWFNEPEGGNPPEPPPSNNIDMALYFTPLQGQYSDIFILNNNWSGGSERCQLQLANGFSYVVKNNQWEKRRIENDAIYLVMDTSPDGSRYYTLETNDGWMPRSWNVGDTFTHLETIRFYLKSNCRLDDDPFTWSGQKRFAGFHPNWESQAGIKLKDVIQIEWWLNGEIEESYWYAPHLGLVAWANRHGMKSWISELIPLGQQENNRRESGCFGS